MRYNSISEMARAGGFAAAKSMTPEQRTKRAKRAAKARYLKQRRKVLAGKQDAANVRA